MTGANVLEALFSERSRPLSYCNGGDDPVRRGELHRHGVRNGGRAAYSGPIRNDAEEREVVGDAIGGR